MASLITTSSMSRSYSLASAVALMITTSIPLAPSDYAVGGLENIEKYAVRRVQPAYPPLAAKMGLQGVVVVGVNVAATGKVAKAEFIRGPNIFRSVSLDAAKRWEFKAGNELNGTIQLVFELEE